MKTTKVKSVQGNGSFEHEFGADQPDGKKLLFSYDYEFEDGVFMRANHKTVPSPFKIGDTVEYEVTGESEKYGKKGRVIKPQEQFSSTSIVQKDDGLQGIKIGHAITNAVHIAISGGFGNINELHLSIKAYAKMILKIGEELNNEISKKAQSTKQAIPPPAPPLDSYAHIDNIIDGSDIPF